MASPGPAERHALLQEVATSGHLRDGWAALRPLVRDALETQLSEYTRGEHQDALLGPPEPLLCKERPEELSARLLQLFDAFPDAAPFTVQRLCELLLDPWMFYRRIDKFGLAVEKLLTVS